MAADAPKIGALAPVFLEEPSPVPEIPDYDHQSIEPRWQKRWEEIGLFKAPRGASSSPAKKRSYCLMMFPYPSGDRLHVGHGRNYILGDAVVRYKIMQGTEVLSPMGSAWSNTTL